MIGQQFGHYTIESRLGSGGMGVVYLARDLRLARHVAIKVLSDGRVTDEFARTRFRREAQALSRLNHPNIATIYDFDQQDGRDFLVMEYIEGQSLRDLGPDPLPTADVVRLGSQLAEALVAAHGAGVVHLDLKPGNMMLTGDGRLKVLDFGIARLHAPDLADASTRTREPDTETVAPDAGTPPYMAPEQVASAPVDGRTDIYAAGATLYELATGRRLFDKPRGPGLYDSILRDKPEPPRRYNAGIPPPLETALLKALEKQPAKRQQTAQELLRDIQTSTDPRAAAGAPPRWRRRGIALTAAATFAAVAVTGYALWPAPVTATFHARDFVLVGDLEDRAGDPLLSRTVQEALSIALQQSKFVNLVSRDRVADALRLMKRPPNAALDEATGRDICQREGVPALIAGSVTKSGNTTQIAIRVIEAGAGGLLFAGTSEYTKPDEIFARVDDLARRLRKTLGESMDTIVTSSQPLQKVTTGSIEALRQYSKAVDARAMGDLDAVEAPLLAALTLDPDFAMAHLKLADYYLGGIGDAVKGQPQIEAAYRLRARVTDRESHLIAAQYFQSRDDFKGSRDSLKVLTTLYPDDPEAHYELALMYYALEDLRPGIAELRRAIELHPRGARAQGSLALLLARDNRPDEAIEATRLALAKGVESPYLYWARGLAFVGANQIGNARTDFERLERTPGYYSYLGRLQQARVSLFTGDLADATVRLKALGDSARAGGARAFELAARIQLALTAAASGDRALVRAQSAAIETLTAHDQASPVELLDSGRVALLAGDAALAKRRLARLASLESSEGTELVRMARGLLAGEIAMHERKPSEAVTLQDDAMRQFPLYRYSRGRAEAREALGDRPGAVAAWKSLLAARGQVIQDGFPPDLAEAQARLDRPGARLKPAGNGKDD
jgi:tetratricopeptide (TPR) repeat protein/predicted Ser/Thr protein kinase